MARLHDWLLPREKASQVFDSAGDELPRWRDKGVLALLVFVLLLELVAWRYSEGYPVADSVEFMERAGTFVRGERIIDSGQIRPFGFSLLIAPIYLLGDWIGLVDPRPVLWTICLFQIACGLLLVYVYVRLGARLGGRRTGLVAGFLIGTNPAFLTYCAMPISGIFAAVCVGFGLESLWERGNARREWIGALWLAASVLMIYQCAGRGDDRVASCCATGGARGAPRTLVLAPLPRCCRSPRSIASCTARSAPACRRMWSSGVRLLSRPDALGTVLTSTCPVRGGDRRAAFSQRMTQVDVRRARELRPAPLGWYFSTPADARLAGAVPFACALCGRRAPPELARLPLGWCSSPTRR
jgi:hypothetical protein